MGTRVQNLKKLEKKEKEVVKKVERKLEKNLGLKGKKTHAKPAQDVIHIKGSGKRGAGTPYAAAKAQAGKFSRTDAALIAWAHTFTNPRTNDPAPVPVAAVPGASAADARMFRVTLRATAQANALGYVFIGARVDGFVPTPLSAGGNGKTADYNRTINVGGGLVGNPVHYTTGTYNGGTIGTTYAGYCYPNASVADVSNGSIAPWTGCNFIAWPDGWIPNLTDGMLLTVVGCELRVRPNATSLASSGSLWLFNYHTMPPIDPNAAPVLYPGNFPATSGATYDAITAVDKKYIARNSNAIPNWKSDKWLSAVAIPNSTTCFDQGIPIAQQGMPMRCVGQPSVFCIGEGMQANQNVEFEVTYVVAVYGYVTNEVRPNPPSAVKVDPGRLATTVQNGIHGNVVPMLQAEKQPNMSGVGGAIKALQSEGRAPENPSMATSMLKASMPVVEAVTGSSIGESIMEGIGALAAFLL